MNTTHGEKQEGQQASSEEPEVVRFQPGHIVSICVVIILLACLEREVFGSFTGSLVSVVADTVRSIFHHRGG